MDPLILLNKQDLLEAVREAMLPLLQQAQQQRAKASINQGESELMTRKEAAAYLKITLVTLNAWTRRGVIESRRICGRVYYFRSELQELPR